MQLKIKRTNSNFQYANKLYWISAYEVLQSWLISTVYHNFETNRGRGEGLKREEALQLITSFSCKGVVQGGAYLRGGLNRGFKLCF